METVESLAAQIGTTSQIGEIVRVMKSLSAVSIRQYDRAADALGAYQQTVELGLQAVLSTGPGAAAETERGPAPARILVFVGSDRGLCGNFNEKIAEFADRAYLAPAAGSGPPVRLLAVGQRGAQYLAARGHVPDRVIDLPASIGGLSSVARRVLLVLDGWQKEAGAIAVDICHNRRHTSSTAAPHGQRLLPMRPGDLEDLAARPWPSRSRPFYRMPRGELFAALLREQVFVKIFHALAESLASEHARRLAAMHAAEHNIEEAIAGLQARHRTLFQRQITEELLDIVSGYEAMRTR
jgi:F-type H+-transporting ATPase subunit gamma